jgi:hypothetical protein
LREDGPKRECRRVGLALAASVALLGVTIAEYVLDASFGIDQLLADRAPLPGAIPGRMGLNTALCLSLLGASLISLPARSRAWRKWPSPRPSRRLAARWLCSSPT